MTSQSKPSLDEALTLAATELVAELFAATSKEWQQELETLRAERRAILAEIRADLAEHKLAVDQIKAKGKCK